MACGNIANNLRNCGDEHVILPMVITLDHNPTHKIDFSILSPRIDTRFQENQVDRETIVV